MEIRTLDFIFGVVYFITVELASEWLIRAKIKMLILVLVVRNIN